MAEPISKILQNRPGVTTTPDGTNSSKPPSPKPEALEGEAYLIDCAKRAGFPRHVPAAELDQVSTQLWQQMQSAEAEKRFPIVITGSPGNGKTSAMAVRFRQLWDVDPREVYWCHMEREVRNLMHQKGELFIRRAWSTKRYVFVDDLGTAMPNDWTYNLMYELIESRSARADRTAMATFYSSNKTIQELKTMYDSRIGSRLAAGTVIEHKGPDRRLKNLKIVETK